MTVRFAEARGLDRYSPVRLRRAEVGTVQEVPIDHHLPPVDGRTFILESRGLSSVVAGAPVQFAGIRVGRVLGSEFNESRKITEVHAFVVQRFADHVRQSTRFWRAGGLNVSLSGGGLNMGGASLASLLNAPIEFTTPDVLPGAPAASGTRFELYDSQIAAEAAADGPQLTYVTYFPGPVKGLQPGLVVTMKGVQVGHVRDVRLRYVPQTATLETPVLIGIDPRKLELPVTDATTIVDLRASMNDALSKLVAKGMRATIASSLVLPGASGVALDFVGKPGTARLVMSDPPIIPAASTSNGIDDALASLGRIAGRIESLPLEEIAGHLRSTAARIDKL